MDLLTAPCDEFLPFRPPEGLSWSTRHEPFALEHSSLECVLLPTSPTRNLSPCLSYLREDGRSVLSTEQATAVVLALNAHLTDKNFESEGRNGMVEYKGSLQFPLNQIEGVTKDMEGCMENNNELPNHVRTLFSRLQVTRRAHESCPNTRTVQWYRRGFWLADSHGFGNTRTIAGIIAQYWHMGIDKAIYISNGCPSETILPREMNALNVGQVKFYKMSRQSEFEQGKTNELKIVLGSYRQFDVNEDCFGWLKNWVGQGDFEGLLILDEIQHVVGDAEMTEAIHQLQELYPRARVVISCPLESLDSKNYNLLWRLGLFGKNMTSQTAYDFLRRLTKRGKFSHTQFLMELKSKGRMIARNVSFQNVTVNLIQCNRRVEYDILYDLCVQLWNDMAKYLYELMEAICLSQLPDDDKFQSLTELSSMFFKNRKSFFDELGIHSKMDEMESILKTLLLKKTSVVVFVSKIKGTGFACRYAELNRPTGWIKAFTGFPYSALMMNLRSTLVELGVAVGYPKLYYANNTWEYVDNSREANEPKLVTMELNKSTAGKVIGRVKTELDTLRGNRSSKDFTQHQQQMSVWLPYSVGKYINHPKLVTPSRLAVWNGGYDNTPTEKNLAIQFHKLYPFLPISLLDEMKLRCTSVLKHCYPYENEPRSRVAEVSGRGHEFVWSEETMEWVCKSTKNACTEYESFKSGIANVMLFDGNHPTELDRYKKRCSYLFTDFSLSRNDIAKQFGQTHNCGRDATFYLLGSGLPGDMKCILNVSKYTSDLGASVYYEDSLRNYCTLNKPMNGLFTERGLAALNSVGLTATPLGDMWQKIIWQEKASTTEMDETTETSLSLVHKFTMQLRYIPIHFQFGFMMAVDAYLLNSFSGEMRSSFREIPQQQCPFDTKLEKTKVVDFMRERCEMFLFRVSRLTTEEHVMEYIDSLDYMFYLDKENYPVCAALCCGTKMSVLYPFYMSPVYITLDDWNKRNVKCVSKEKGLRVWRKCLDRLRRKRNLCGHDRLKKPVQCPLETTTTIINQKCLYQWGTTRFLVVTGEVSSLMDRLEQYCLPMQHCKFAIAYQTESDTVTAKKTVGRSTYAGWFISMENFKQSAADVFTEIESIVEKSGI